MGEAAGQGPAEQCICAALKLQIRCGKCTPESREQQLAAAWARAEKRYKALLHAWASVELQTAHFAVATGVLTTKTATNYRRCQAEKVPPEVVALFVEFSGYPIGKCSRCGKTAPLVSEANALCAWDCD